jgi:hypothetical protein
MGEIQEKMGRLSLYIILRFHCAVYVEHVIIMQCIFYRVPDCELD